MHRDSPIQPTTTMAELASIFATAILRLQKQGQLRGISDQAGTKPSGTCLEVPSETVLSVHRRG